MIRFAVCIAGAIAMGSQIVFLREFLVAFCGNEFAVGTILAVWLIGGAAGSAAAGSRSLSPGAARTAFASVQLAVAALLPAGIAAVRLARPLLGYLPGQIVPFSVMAAASLVILFPFCALLGSLFSFGCAAIRGPSAGPAFAVGGVFIAETAGSVAGGVAVSLFLIRTLGSFEIAIILAMLAVFSSVFLTLRSGGGSGSVRAVRLRALVIGGVLLAAMVSGLWRTLGAGLSAAAWPGYHLVGSRDSVYGRVTVIEREGQYSLFDNGLHLYTIPDRMAAEEAAHFPLLEHPAPRSALLIGGGPGILAEALKQPLARIEYVELDPLIIAMTRDSLPPAMSACLDDRRVAVINADGRQYVKNGRSLYDCIIVALGDPYTEFVNRYYTVEFFREAARVLAPGGILSFALSSSENYITPDLAAYLGSIYRTLGAVFPDVKVIPGDRAVFLAARAGAGEPLTCDHRLLDARAAERTLDRAYMREGYLASRLSGGAVAYLRAILDASAHGKINRDFWPVSYYYATTYWASQFRGSCVRRLFTGISETHCLSGFAAFCVVLVLICRAGRGGFDAAVRRSVSAGVLVAGMTGMAFQVVIVLAFQALYGSVYYRIGIILTAYMAGLAAGGVLAVRYGVRSRCIAGLFACIQAILAAYLVLLPWVFAALARPGMPTAWWGAQAVFAALSLCAGCLGGIQFPLAAAIAGRGGEDAHRTGGRLYAVDLAGACAGAVATSAILVPVIGAAQTCYGLAALNAAIAVGLGALIRQQGKAL